MVQLGKVLDVLNTLTEEMAMHSSDLYDIRRRSVSLEGGEYGEFYEHVHTHTTHVCML